VVPARSGPSNSSFASDFSRDTPFPDGGGLSAPGHVDGTSPLLRSGGFRPKSGSWQKNRLSFHWTAGRVGLFSEMPFLSSGRKLVNAVGC
jgi:hypothetical protein